VSLFEQTVFKRAVYTPSWEQVESPALYKRASDADINLMAVIVVLGFGVVIMPLAPFSGLIFAVTCILEFLGFGRRIHGAMNQGRRGLKVRHGFGDDFLREGVCDNG
jgi:hypothetical protein